MKRLQNYWGQEAGKGLSGFGLYGAGLLFSTDKEQIYSLLLTTLTMQVKANANGSKKLEKLHPGNKNCFPVSTTGFIATGGP